MKKIVTFALALALSLALFSMTASAAIATPFKDSSLKIAVVEKFEDSSYSVYLGIPDGVASELPAAFSFNGGKFAIGAGAEAHAWAGVASPKLEAFTATGAVGWGFYVKNTTATALDHSFSLTTESNNLNGTAYGIFSDQEYVLVNKANGTETLLTAPHVTHPYNADLVVQSNISIPAGFDGYVLIPFASTCKVWAGGNDEKATDAMNYKAFGWNGGATPVAGGELIVDNLFFYGNITAKDADLISVNKDGNGKPDTGDISLIAPLAALAVALPAGALALRKKNQK